MSLEQALAANTAAIEALTAAVIAGNEGREEVLAVAKAASTKAPAKPKAAAAETPAAEKPSETAAEAPKEDAVVAAVTAYMAGQEGAERDARKAKVAEVFGKVGAKKRGEIPADKEAAVVKAINTLAERGNVIVEAEAEDDGDDLLGD